MSYYKLTLFIACLCLLCGGSQAQTKVATAMADFVTPRMRVIIDNDFSGDPDGLFQLAHHLLSPSVEIRGIIGSHLKAGAGFGSEAKNSAKAACEQVNDQPKGRPIRIYNRLDVRLMFADMIAKLKLAAQ